MNSTIPQAKKGEVYEAKKVEENLYLYTKYYLDE